ncbi:hypothetical protein VP01_2236g1 [Puccinia sorghi]|uniref:Uncharacterized protein n=1 Tax=Puccinia sorghi TaxID=27349 RepID=A0A0L6V8S9_9BASI|nr:hypothetical protein VP01_2236g1 [Puccinia sorghi]
MQRNDGQRPEKTKKNELKNQEHKLLIRDSEKQMRGTQWSIRNATSRGGLKKEKDHFWNMIRIIIVFEYKYCNQLSVSRQGGSKQTQWSGCHPEVLREFHRWKAGGSKQKSSIFSASCWAEWNYVFSFFSSRESTGGKVILEKVLGVGGVFWRLLGRKASVNIKRFTPQYWILIFNEVIGGVYQDTGRVGCTMSERHYFVIPEEYLDHTPVSECRFSVMEVDFQVDGRGKLEINTRMIPSSYMHCKGYQKNTTTIFLRVWDSFNHAFSGVFVIFMGLYKITKWGYYVNLIFWDRISRVVSHYTSSCGRQILGARLRMVSGVLRWNMEVFVTLDGLKLLSGLFPGGNYAQQVCANTNITRPCYARLHCFEAENTALLLQECYRVGGKKTGCYTTLLWPCRIGYSLKSLDNLFCYVCYDKVVEGVFIYSRLQWMTLGYFGSGFKYLMILLIYFCHIHLFLLLFKLLIFFPATLTVSVAFLRLTEI